MLSPRSKIIILIAGSLLVFILLLGTLFGWFRRPAAPSGEESAAPPDLSFLQEKPVGENLVFDASNPEALAAYDPRTSPAGQNVSPLERQARNLAAFFAERFGTYSSDAGFAYLDDLAGLMTKSMQDWTRRFRREQPKRTGYFAVVTEVASLDTVLFSPEARQAKFNLIVNRTETSANKYQQKADIELTQDANGEWKVNSLYWGEKL